MDTTLLILVLTGACAFVFGIVLALAVRLVLDKRAKHSDAETTVAKWLTENSRQTEALTRLRGDVQTLRAQVEKAVKTDGKDTYKQLERIKQLEADMDWAAGQIEDHTALIAELQPPARAANSTNGRYVR